MTNAILTKPTFSVDQMISSTDAGRKFSELRKRAKKCPQFVTDHNEVETVVMSYSQYEAMFSQLEEYKEYEIEMVAAERLQSSSAKIPLQKALSKSEHQEYKNTNADSISDEDLFE